MTTKVLNAATTSATAFYTVSTVILDGLLRTRQTQAVSPDVDGGRMLTDTLYDNNGRASMVVGPYRATGEPDTTLFIPAEGEVPNRIETQYDNANRVVAAIQYNLHEELWRTTTSYGGDYTTVIPPDGGTPTTTITDAHGRTIELRQHLTPDASGAFQSTMYEYTRAGQLHKVTDPEGNFWEYGYDLLGRQTTTVDPDKGTSTSEYNAFGDLTGTTDARGVTLGYEYDQLGRKTGMYEGDIATGEKLAEWRYDDLPGVRVARGHATGWSRYVDGHEYRYDVQTMNQLYQVGAAMYTIPAVEGTLAGAYSTGTEYRVDGSVSYISYDAVGGVLGESVLYDYDQRTGLPVRMSDTAGNRYVTGTTYTAFGELQSVRYANTAASFTEQTHYYDSVTRRLEQSTVLAEASGDVLSDNRYHYDDMGNVTSIWEEIATTSSASPMTSFAAWLRRGRRSRVIAMPRLPLRG